MYSNTMPGNHNPAQRKTVQLLTALLLFIAAGSPSSFGQPPTPPSPTNLIANPSFEDVNICSEYNQPCSPSAWFFENRKVTSGYFPRFPSATGHRHLQIVIASRQMPDREYWETMLLCPLVAGEKYTVSLKVTALGSRPNLRDIGFWFTDHFIFSRVDSLLQPRSYLKFTDAIIKDSKNGWLEITKEFTPSKTASFLIIGNFYGAPNNDIMDQRQRPDPDIEIGIDDVSITPANNLACPSYNTTKDSLYAILRRHSNPPYGEIDEEPEEHPAKPARRDIDTATRNAPPRPTTDAPRAAQPQPAPEKKTDTLIIRNIQFEFDKYLVDNPDTLLRYKKILTRPDVKRIKVVGYTDDNGTEAYNKDLSEKRAREVARLLTTKFGIPASIIESEGRGISRDYPTKDLNRRVEIYIFH